MRYVQENCNIISVQEIAPEIYDMVLQAPKISEISHAGQFVNILCDGFQLRRPISLCAFDKEEKTIRIVFQIRGEGTKWLTSKKAGDFLDLVGPLGRGFSLEDPTQKAVIIGGGIGTPPLLPIAEFYKDNASVITGFKTKNLSILQNDFKAHCNVNLLCTDDGSAGLHGFTTKALIQLLENQICDVIYTCGPFQMMKGISDIAKDKEIKCYVSMEERMACGIGACHGCTCMTLDAKGSQRHSRVCLSGPVFNALEVGWNV